jgi:COP9 signalosome complex subunit 7
MADPAAKLEPYLLLARSTRGAAAAKVIEDATSAVSICDLGFDDLADCLQAGVYVFSELLDIPGIATVS